MKPSRYPSLQIPASTPADLRAFLEGVKERLEITTGDRGDPRDRLLTVRDVEAAGMATVTVRNKFATLSGGATAKSVAALMSDSGTTGTFDGVLAPSLETLTESQVTDATDFITYNNTVARLQRVPYQTLRALFLHEDSDAELTGNWQFQNEELALEISAEVPRFRFTESSSTEVLPTDGNVWDWTVDDQLMALSLVSDDEDTTAVMLELARDGMNPSFLALVNGTILQIQDGTLADPGLTFDDDIDTGAYRISANRFGLSAGGVLALDITGTQLLVPTGTAGAPGLAFQGDADTGPFRAAANEYAIATGGAERLRINSTGIRVTGTALLDAGVEAAPAFAFAAATGTGIYRTGGASLAIAVAGVLTAAFNTSGQNTTLNGTAALPGFAFISDPDTGAYRVGSNQYGISAGGNVRLTASATAVSVQGVPLLLPDGITAPGLAVTSFAQLYVDTADGDLKIMYDDATVKIFAYTGHAHAISDITGLTAALAAKLDAASYTAADVLAKLLTVDGAGSGIDADLLDGSSSAAFLQLATYQTLTPTWANAHTFSVTPVVPDSSWTYAKIQNVSATSRVLGRITAGAGVIEELTGANIATIVGYTAADVLAKLLTVDGAGSGIDADLLDGNNSAAFALLSGATFTGVVIGPNGAVGAPAFAFAGANNSGMYRTGGGSLGLSVAGVLTAAFNANGQNTLLDGTVALPAVAFISDPDTGVYRVSSNVLGLTCAGTQVLSIATAQVQIITTTLRLDTTTATTVGAAGAAAALPANPLGYIAANIGGTAVKIPYYTA